VTQETEAELAWRLRYDLTRVGITFAAAAAVAVLLGLFVIR
jgi:ABC-type nitrate/sulfonate/bicarbonate transport system permease component